jgi:hypothetical protein
MPGTASLGENHYSATSSGNAKGIPLTSNIVAACLQSSQSDARHGLLGLRLRTLDQERFGARGKAVKGPPPPTCSASEAAAGGRSRLRLARYNSDPGRLPFKVSPFVKELNENKPSQRIRSISSRITRPTACAA